MNSFKHMLKSWTLINAVFLLLVVTTQPALADSSFDITDLTASLPSGWAEGVTAVIALLYVIAQIRAVLPPSVTNRIPSVVMIALDFIAANYRHTRNVASPAKPEPVAAAPDNDDYRVTHETAKNKGELRGNSIESAGANPGNRSSDNKSA